MSITAVNTRSPCPSNIVYSLWFQIQIPATCFISSLWTQFSLCSSSYCSANLHLPTVVPDCPTTTSFGLDGWSYGWTWGWLVALPLWTVGTVLSLPLKVQCVDVRESFWPQCQSHPQKCSHFQCSLLIHMQKKWTV